MTGTWWILRGQRKSCYILYSENTTGASHSEHWGASFNDEDPEKEGRRERARLERHKAEIAMRVPMPGSTLFFFLIFQPPPLALILLFFLLPTLPPNLAACALLRATLLSFPPSSSISFRLHARSVVQLGLSTCLCGGAPAIREKDAEGAWAGGEQRRRTSSVQTVAAGKWSVRESLLSRRWVSRRVGHEG